MPVSFCYCYCHHKNQLFEDSYTYVHKYSKWRVYIHHNVDIQTNFFFFLGHTAHKNAGVNRSVHFDFSGII